MDEGLTLKERLAQVVRELGETHRGARTDSLMEIKVWSPPVAQIDFQAASSMVLSADQEMSLTTLRESHQSRSWQLQRTWACFESELLTWSERRAGTADVGGSCEGCRCSILERTGRASDLSRQVLELGRERDM